MSHGMGHLIGLDTHDVGGYGYGLPERPDDIGVNLRTSRQLKENMVLTVEPGLYFPESKLLTIKNDEKHELHGLIDWQAIEPFLSFGGVRIESVVHVTGDGCEDWTQVPRTVEEIEEFFRENNPAVVPSKEGEVEPSSFTPWIALIV